MVRRQNRNFKVKHFIESFADPRGVESLVAHLGPGFFSLGNSSRSLRWFHSVTTLRYGNPLGTGVKDPALN